MILSPGVFNLPPSLIEKADPRLIADDERQFDAIDHSLRQSIDEVETKLAAVRLLRGGTGQAALDRDLEVHRLSSRLRPLRRFGLDLCLGRTVAAEGSTSYIGRFGLADADGRRLVLDWRSPAAEPFFGATHANPMGLTSRRRYRWTRGRISDFWDEVFAAEALDGTHPNPALDDQSAFVASLNGSRTSRMRDVLATIQSDQDAIIRAGSRGTLVVDGGPGTGKTVVALHRTAYLLYSDPLLDGRRGGVLFVGPSPAYLAYISDVLPALGEEGVHTCALRDLVPEGAQAIPETEPAIAELKASIDVLSVIEKAVGFVERPPTTGLTIETDWAELRVEAADWSDAFAAADPATPHNEARDEVWEALLDILLDRLGDDEGDDDDDRDEEFDAYGRGRSRPDATVRRALASDRELGQVFGRAWPLVDPSDLVRRLWSDPAFLARCAPALSGDETTALQRPDSHVWTTSDLPFLDLARRRLGDPGESLLRRRREAAAALEQARMSEVVDDLIANDDSELKVMSMLRGQDMRSALADEDALPKRDPDLLAGPFAHIVVDEAQELTDAEWQMLLARCPSRSFTIVGDRAQARRGFTESWQQRLERVGLCDVRVRSLTINYRTPSEVMAEAEPVIREALPDANVPTSVRSTGVPVAHGKVSELHSILEGWLEAHAEGTACVIGAHNAPSDEISNDRVRWLTPELSKGLEFDLVVLIDPDAFGSGIKGAVDRYVAMTRATQQLVLLGDPGTE